MMVEVFVLIVQRPSWHFHSVQMKETFARSSVSCLTGADLQSITAARGDPCWQVTQQLHLLIEKVRWETNADLFAPKLTGESLERKDPRGRLQPSVTPLPQNDLCVSVFVDQYKWLSDCLARRGDFWLSKLSVFSLARSGSKTPHPLESGHITKLTWAAKANEANDKAALVMY